MKSPRFISVTPQFSKKQIDVYLNQQLLRLEAAVLSRFQRVGETFVTNARENGNYQDVTGNLRSSIGYVILKDGVQLFENFSTASKGKYGGAKAVQKKKYGGLKGEEGVSKAKQLITRIGKRYARGVCLICVAGMDYAAAVESRGKDVITASSLLAKDQLQKAFRDLQNKL